MYYTTQASIDGGAMGDWKLIVWLVSLSHDRGQDENWKAGGSMDNGGHYRASSLNYNHGGQLLEERAVETAAKT